MPFMKVLSSAALYSLKLSLGCVCESACCPKRESAYCPKCACCPKCEDAYCPKCNSLLFAFGEQIPSVPLFQVLPGTAAPSGTVSPTLVKQTYNLCNSAAWSMRVKLPRKRTFKEIKPFASACKVRGGATKLVQLSEIK